MTVTYPDGTSEDVPVTVTVNPDDSDEYTPSDTGKTVTQGSTLDPADTITVKDANGKEVELPTGSTVTWKDGDAIDTLTTGPKTGTVTVTYPDGSSEDVSVTVTVNPKDSDVYDVNDAAKTVDKGTTLDPEDTITVKDANGNDAELPTGTTVTWKEGTTPIDTTTAGTKTGTVTVTYPDGTSKDVPVTVTVNPDDSDTYAPTGQDLTTTVGTTPEASSGISNTADLPSDTTYSWQTAPDVTTAGDKTGTILVTYPDSSTDTVTVTVHVKNADGSTSEVETYTPVGQDLTVKRGDAAPSAESAITNTSDLPSDATYSWKKDVDTSTSGDKSATVVVTYADGTKDEVPVTVHVNQDQAELNEPQGQNQTVNKGDTPSAEDSIANKDQLPDGTKYDWATTPTTTKSGDQKATVVVTYPDGSKDTVDVTVHVNSDAEANEPQGQPQTVNKGDEPKAENSIANKDSLPDGTKYTWEKTPDTSTDGTKTGTVVVTYPDGTQDKVDVKINVNNDAAENELQGQAQTVKMGETPDPAKSVANKSDLPTGTTYSWKTAVDTSTTGDKTATLVATYPDGSADETTVTIHVLDDAQENTPQGKDQVVNKGESSAAEDSIANKDKLPEDTTYEWAKTPDTTTSGDQTATVVVNYPDGSSENVTVNIHVNNDAESNEPQSQVQTVNKNETPDPAKSIANKDDLPEGTTYAWQEPIDTTTSGDKTGTIVVTYPDGSKDTVTAKVHVNDDAESNEPQAQEQIVNKNDEVDPAKSIANKDELPTGTTYDWATEPDTTTSGDKTGQVTVTYPDGSKDKVDVTVHVNDDSETYQAQGQDQTVKQNTTVKAEDSIANKDSLPDDTTYEWVDPIDTSSAGDKAGTVKVTYPDGSSETVDVTIHVGKTNAEENTPQGKDQTVNKNSAPVAADSINNKGDLPVDTTYKWQEPVNTSTAGDKDATVVVTYPDGSADTVNVTIHVKNDEDSFEPNVPGTKVPVDNTDKLTDAEKDQVKKNVEDANKDENGKSTLPDGSQIAVGDDGTATVTYPDGSDDVINGDKLVREKTDTEKYDPTVPDTKTPVDNTKDLTDNEKDQVKKNIEDANKDENGKSTLPDGTDITIGDDGTATITYPDGTSDEITGDQLVCEKTDAEKNDPVVPDTKTPVDDNKDLTDTEKDTVKDAIEDANKDENGNSTLPDDTDITIGDDGTATITYPDGTKDTIPGDDLVREKTDAEKYDPQGTTQTVDQNKTPKAEDSIANKDNLPDGTKYDWQDPIDTSSAGDKTGTVVVTYPDGTKDTVDVTVTVDQTDAEKNTPTVPTDKTPVDDPKNLTDDEKSQVKDNVIDSNTDENGKSTLPDGTEVEVGDNGDTTVTYPDGSKDTIPGTDLVTPKTDAEKNDPKVPTDKVPVDDTKNLTDGEKDQVKDNVENANKDENGKSTLPDGTDVTIGDDGTATITYPDGSKDTIPGTDLVTPKDNTGETKTDADENDPKVPTDKVPVDDTKNLTDEEKDQVKDNVEDANKDENGKSTLPDGTDVTIGDDGTATITYPDGSKDTIPGTDLVTPKDDTQKETDADKNDPKVPTDKTPVDDPKNLTDEEKSQVKDNVIDSNTDENGKSTLPDGTEVEVGDNGDTTVTYPDGSKDTIPGTDLVTPKTDADKNDPKVPTDKVPVDDTKNLTDTEKDQVKDNVENANKDENGKSTLPDGTEITIGDDGTATITYPDNSKDTIPGDQLVTSKDNTGEETKTDADKNTPTVPGDKTTVNDPKNLTDEEKGQVKDSISNANKDENGKSTLPDGTEIDVDDNGNATITYPDGSKDTIPGSDLVTGKEDTQTYADKNDPTVPGDKVKVNDATKLTDEEKDQVKDNIINANKDENGNSTLPDGTEITIGDDGTATITYPDGSTDTIPGSDLVTEKTAADKTDPTVPGTKVEVTDPSHLTDEEKAQVKDNIENANKDENGNSTLPEGTEITIGDDGTATITYPDGSTDTISGNELVVAKEAASGSASGTTGQGGQGTNQGNQGSTATEPLTPGTTGSNAKANNQATLPQTGDEHSQTGLIAGLLAATAGLLGLGLGKKKREDD